MASANTPPPQAPKLLDQVRSRIRVKHYSIRTEAQYVQLAQGGSGEAVTRRMTIAAVARIDTISVPKHKYGAMRYA